MANNSENFFKKNKYWIGTILLMLVSFGIIFYAYDINERTKREIDELEGIDSLKTYYKLYYEKEFASLKNENRELYDSLKAYKNTIDYIIQFTHEKEYSTGTVQVRHDTVYKKEDIPQYPSTYEYKGEMNDTFNYKLTLNSLVEPNWYNITAKVKEQFTIVNKRDENSGQNLVTIHPSNGGDIENVTVFKKKKNNHRFYYGPSITAGYDPINNKFGVMGGFGVLYYF